MKIRNNVRLRMTKVRKERSTQDHHRHRETQQRPSATFKWLSVLTRIILHMYSLLLWNKNVIFSTSRPRRSVYPLFSVRVFLSLVCKMRPGTFQSFFCHTISPLVSLEIDTQPLYHRMVVLRHLHNSCYWFILKSDTLSKYFVTWRMIDGKHLD